MEPDHDPDDPRRGDPLWSEAAIRDSFFDPSRFYTSQEGSARQAQQLIDQRIDQIYLNLPGDRTGFLIAITGAIGMTVSLLFLGSLWAIGPGVFGVMLLLFLTKPIFGNRSGL